MESLRWTPYLDECLRLLEETKEFSTDELLICLVRVQRIRNSIATVRLTSCFESTGSDLLSEAHVQLFISQVEEIKQSIPTHLKSNGNCSSTSTPFLSFYHSLRVQ